MIRPRLLPLLALSLAALPAFAADSVDLSRTTPVPADQAIPVADFFRPRIMQDPKLNLAGSHIAAMITGGGDKVQLLVVDLKDQKTNVISTPTDLDVTDFEWLNDRRLIYNLSAHNRGNLGLLAVDFDQITRAYPVCQYYGEVLVAVPKDDKTHPLVWGSYDQLETNKQMGVFQLDTTLSSGQFVDLSVINAGSMDPLIAKENNNRHILKRYPQAEGGWATNYYADQVGALECAVTAQDGVNTLQFLSGDSWQKCPVDLDQIAIVGPGTKFGELAVVGPRGTGQPRPLQLLDVASGKLGDALIQDKEYDFNGYLYRDPGSHVIVGAVFNRSGPTTVWFHEAYAKLQQALNGFFPGLIVRILGNDEKGELVLVSTWSDRQPPVYQWVNLATKQVGIIQSSAPWIDAKRMLPMSVIKYKTRDGQRLDAYVTMPAGATKQHPPPLVVLPHDGPLARDVWGFNEEVQFLASRGYAVLQPNYRGSTGYGWMFPESEDWDYVKMAEDVTDATQMLVRAGLVDGKRVGILGTSFGGYLALQCATSEPDLFKCSAAITGIFDWEELINDNAYNRYTNPQYGRWVRKLGDPGRDKARFEAISPLRHVNRLHGAVFLAIGREDSEPIRAQTSSLNSELDKNHVPHDLVTLSGVGRSMYYVKNRVEVYSRLESFLAQNLR
ncbi:MAG TPA: alpha/beta fold hydrolase [Lacunisphaera sp.]|jgi:dipeptidyl aminopeptidase/acylaminoacyl peptidase|nr:alpha/beta fold hydrolase [Lacunisphaera sp.]